MKLSTLRQHRMTNLAQLTMQEWFADNTPRHAAALAYYTIFALSPLFTIVFSIAGALYGYDVAKTTIVSWVKYYVPNPGVAEMLQTVLANSIASSSNLFLTMISIAVLIYGATSVFGELQSALNLIWDAPVKNTISLWDFLWNRLFAILMVFSGGLVIFASLIISTVIAAVNQWAEVHLHVTIYSEWSVFFTLFAISTVVFALIYKFVPDVQIAWHDVIIGAMATGLLFTVARAVINWSLRYGSISSIFGATGSLVVFLVWIYYSALIFFLGAEFTQVYGRTYGSRWRELQLLEETSAEEKPPTLETAEGIIVKEQDREEAFLPEIEEESEEEASSAEALPETIEATESNDEAAPDSVAPDEPQARTIGERVQHGMRKVQESGKKLSRIPATIGSPIGDIAIGVAVVGVISIAGMLFEPWRRKRKAEKE